MSRFGTESNGRWGQIELTQFASPPISTPTLTETMGELTTIERGPIEDEELAEVAASDSLVECFDAVDVGEVSGVEPLLEAMSQLIFECPTHSRDVKRK